MTARSRGSASSTKKKPLTGARQPNNFPKPVLRRIAGEVGYLCSNHACGAPTSGPSATKGVSNVGVGAHITAARPKGARYDAALTIAQRKSAANAIWLCQRCGKLVDDDSATYTVDDLLAWKAQAIERARRALETGKVLPAGPSKAARRHDERIFETSDSVCSEAKLVMVAERLLSDHSVRLVDLRLVDRWIEFFSLEGSQYLIPALRAATVKLRDAIHEMTHFIAMDFFADNSNTRLVMRPQWNVDRGGSWKRADRLAYAQCTAKLDDLVTPVRKAYTTYRRAVADHLQL